MVGLRSVLVSAGSVGERERRTLRLALCAISVFALLLRVGVASRFQGLGAEPNFDAQPDQIEYEQFAYRLSAGLGYTTNAGVPTATRPPGTSFAIYPIYVLFGHSYWWARLWFCLLSALTCAATGWLAWQCFSPAAGILAAAWLAVYPGHFYYPMHFVSEVPYALALTLALLLSIRIAGGARIKPYVSLSAGVLWGFAVLTRPQIALAVPIVLLAIIMAPNRSRVVWRHVAALTVGFVLTLAPWIVRNAVVLGKPTLSTIGGYTLWGASNPKVVDDPTLAGRWVRTSELVDAGHPLSGGELERDAAAQRYGLTFLNEHRRDVPRLVVMRIWRLVSPFEPTPNRPVFWAFALSWIVTAPWFVAGLVIAWRQNRRIAWVLIAPLLATFATVVMFYGSIRFRDSIAPVFVALAAGALAKTLSAFAANGATVGTRARSRF